jgi:hypothetical protein
MSISILPDPHRCPHLEGCLCSSVEDLNMQDMPGRDNPKCNPNPYPNLEHIVAEVFQFVRNQLLLEMRKEQ